MTWALHAETLLQSCQIEMAGPGPATVSGLWSNMAYKAHAMTDESCIRYMLEAQQAHLCLQEGRRQQLEPASHCHQS